MSDVNTVTVSGRITRDPVLKTLAGGTSICEVSLASNRKFKDNEETVFIDVDIWGKQGEVLSEFLHKGKYIVVTGRLKQDRWNSEDGTAKTKISIVAESVTLPPLQAKQDE